MLTHGTKLNGVQWTPEVLEGWLLKHCWPMGYSQYPSWKIGEMRQRFTHAVKMVQDANQRRSLTHDTHYDSGRSSVEDANQWRTPADRENDSRSVTNLSFSTTASDHENPSVTNLSFSTSSP